MGVVERRRTVHRPTRLVVLRIAVPLVALGFSAPLVLLWAAVSTFALGDLSWLYQIASFFAVASACGFFFFRSSWPVTGAIVGGLIFFSVNPASSGIQHLWLDGVGRTTSCQVTTVDRRTYSEWVDDGSAGDDGFGGGGHYETRVVYRHHLRCPDGGPTELSRPYLLAYDGETLRVVQDPGGRVPPLAVSERRTTWQSVRTLVVMYGLAALVLLAEALVDLARYPRRSAWDFGDWGLFGGSFMNLASRR